jgi:hypothetical protein
MENGKIDFPLPKSNDSHHLGVSTSSPQRGSSSGTPQSEEDLHNVSRLANADFRGSPNKNFEARQADEEKQEEERQSRLDPNRPLSSTRAIGGGDVEEAIIDLDRTDRLQGESGKDYEDRRKESREINAIKDPVEKTKALNEYAEKALMGVSIENISPNEFIPLCVTRADGRTKSLIYVKSAVSVEATRGVTRDVGDYFDGYTHPFKVVLKKTSSSSTAQAGVVYYSHLFKSLKPSDTQSITGLLSRASDSGSDGTSHGDVGSPPPTPTPPATAGGVDHPSPPTTQNNGINGWVNVNDGDYVYLEIAISDGSVTSANIKVGSGFNGSANAWSTGAYVEGDSSDPPKQTFARVALAKIVNGFPEQYVTTNLVMQSMCINGRGALYPRSI